MLYRADFIGRQKNAIGVRYSISTLVEAENEEKARLKLYDFYEHIMFLKLIEVKPEKGE